MVTRRRLLHNFKKEMNIIKTETKFKVIDENGVVITEIKEGDRILRKKSQEYYSKQQTKNNNEFSKLQNYYCGNFIFFLFNNLETLEEILTDAELISYIYIATYLKKDGILQLDNKKNITKSDLKKILKLSNNRANEFIKKLIDNDLLIIKDKIYHININYFFRGTIEQYKKLTDSNIKEFIKLYIDSTRDLYNNYTFRQHKKISILYKLIPYINWRYNVLCYNVKEKDKNKINPLNFKDIISIAGYNKSNITRFKKDLLSLKYKGKPIFGIFTKYDTRCVLVNPLFFSKHTDVDELNYLLALFDIKER